MNNPTAGLNNVDGTVTAENNWWGCNAGPGSAGCDAVTGTADFNPWMTLRASATPNTISAFGSSMVNTNMTLNSDNASPTGTLPNMPVSYSATNGTMTPTSGTVTAGMDSSTFNSTNSNNAVATVTVDNQPVNVPITVIAPSPTPTATATATATSTATATATATFTPTPTPTATFTPTPTPTATATAVPNVIVAGSTGADGSYATLKAAFDAINANTTQTGNNITVTIAGDTNEATTTASLLQPTGGSWTTLTITPVGARTVTGATTAGSPLIDLNGADNVMINGLNTGGNSLTISNTTASATASTSTIRLIGGATGNTIQNCSILGSSSAAAGTAGGNVLVSTSTVAGGNSNNTVSGNNIGPAGVNLPSKGVMGLGTAANPNTGNLITNNNIFDFFSATAAPAGISIQANNNNWTISNNRLYQTATRTFTGNNLRYSGILVASAGNTFIVSGNVIGFGAANGTGTTTITGTGTGLGGEFRGIVFTNSSTTAFSTIQNNIVSGINHTSSRNSTTTDVSAFIGIQSGSSATDAPANMSGNTIGSLDGSSTIVVNQSSVTANTAPVQGILDFNLETGLNVSNNNIGSITINSGGTGTMTGFRGILIGGDDGPERDYG